MKRTGSTFSRIFVVLFCSICICGLMSAAAFAAVEDESSSMDGTLEATAADRDELAAVELSVQEESNSGQISVAYVDAQGNDMGQVRCTPIPSIIGGIKGTTLRTGWYVVEGNVSRGDFNGITVEGNANVILCDGAKFDSESCIYVPGGSTLTIWGQREGTGQLVVKENGKNYAAIGSCYSEWDSSEHAKRGTGNVVINGGVINAKGGDYAAGIGGGRFQSGGHVTINGGIVTATAGRGAAGIGDGANARPAASDVTINGGVVNATGGCYQKTGDNGGAGIGGGDVGVNGSTSADVTITGGTVVAVGGGKTAAGIGGGSGCQGQSITIKGGDVTAIAGGSAPGIGCGANYDGKKTTVTLDYDSDDPTSRINATSYKGTVKVAKKFVDESNAEWAVNAGSYKDPADLAGKTLVPPNTYRVFLDSGDHGTVIADKTIAAPGNEVTLRVTPDEGYRVAKITVLEYYAGEEAEAVSGKEAAQVVDASSFEEDAELYTFEAVDHDMLVQVTWKLAVADDSYYVKWNWNGSTLEAERVDMPEDAVYGLPLTGEESYYLVESGVYFVDEDTVVDKPLRFKGDVTLIIPDDVELNVEANMSLFDKTTLTVYGQEEGSGIINVKGAGVDRSPSLWLFGGKMVFDGATMNVTGGMAGKHSVMDGFCVRRDGELVLADERDAACSSCDLLIFSRCPHGDGAESYIDETGKKVLKCKYCNTILDGLGADRYLIETLEGAPVIDSDNMPDVVNATFTEEEFANDYYLLLISSPFGEAGAPEADKAALEATAKGLGASAGTWFDISMFKKRQTDESVNEQLHEAAVPVNLSVEVPQGLRKDGRTFYLIEYHDGETTIVAKGEGSTLTGTCDRFSTFLLAYKDASGSSSGKTTAEKSSSKTSPKTGDGLNVFAVSAIVIAVVAGFAAVFAYRRRSSK